MSIAVVSYSLTGNNEALAASLAKVLSAEHIRITEPKKRGNGGIFLDALLNRTPQTSPAPEMLDKYSGIIFVAPVWMGQPAYPLRSYWKHLRKHPRKYGFISISGGALNPNPHLRDTVSKHAGSAPSVFVDMHIADLLPKDTKIDTKAVGAFKLSEREGDKAALTARAAAEIKKVFG